MTKNAYIEKLVDMIFAMVKEYALNLKKGKPPKETEKESEVEK